MPRKTMISAAKENFERSHPYAILVGTTSGLPSWRKNSNIGYVVTATVAKGYDEKRFKYCRVRGAHMRSGRGGWQWAIYAEPRSPEVALQYKLDRATGLR